MNSESSLEEKQGQPPKRSEIETAFWQLCEVVAKLRSPQGCPWDRKQTLETIKPYTLEETYELLEAIDSGDDAAIAEELGDLLLQVVLDAQIAADEQRFDIIDVVKTITEKMIRRHPHVFGEQKVDSAEQVKGVWEAIKQDEKQERTSRLDGIPKQMPALAKALRLQEKAARVGYDFPHRDMLFDKLQEELDELREELYESEQVPERKIDIHSEHVPDEEIADADRRSRIEGELGDVLFVIANIARRWKVNPEEALRKTNAKFTRRFQAIEDGLKRDQRPIEQATLAEMEEYYQREKMREKQQLKQNCDNSD